MHAWESIQKVLEYIEDNLSQSHSSEELAKIAALSPFYFQRLFSRLVGKPVREYVKLRRLARASKSLGGKQSRILDIALDCGFGSHARDVHQSVQGSLRHDARSLPRAPRHAQSVRQTRSFCTTS